ncbi:C-type lectin domain-containing protein [Caenorhabditis elegans]|uniref:C-type lectin domain-containing protein n=1 Tax=Caenorhabditis elegans TaxID=6239 RepID=Q9XWP9_CAEEL|nr:C-type lectin domain-containing protein [Caenorhabditis elegans]CAA21601.1 C-type lectin domain-containing protein [Caenorhabditis elegans]|eukprot:NP_507582.1 Uncharacterized protein CELE_Y51A2A.6 [Caenorhabditis elegans]
MKALPLILLLLFGISACTAIFVKNNGGGKNHGFSSASSSSSSSSEEGKKHGHGHHHHNHGRPSRPRPTRPPRAPVCPSDWMTFDRPQGKWCVKAFYVSGNHSVAEAKCNENSATLTGFQTSDERMKTARNKTFSTNRLFF